MQLEAVAILLGLLFVGAGLVLIADAVIPDGTFVPKERRQHPRAERHLVGEMALGVGTLCLGIVFLAAESWPYSTVVMLAAGAFLGVGVGLNWAYLRGMLVRRETGRT